MVDAKESSFVLDAELFAIVSRAMAWHGGSLKRAMTIRGIA